MFRSCLVWFLFFGFVACLSTNTADAYVGTGTGTQLMLHLNEGDGQTLFDESANNNNGFRGAAAGADGQDGLWVDTPYGFTSLRHGNGIDFIINDFAQVASSASLQITNAITLEGWTSPFATPAGAANTVVSTIVSKWDRGAAGGASYSLGLNGTNVVFCLSADGVHANRVCLTSAATINFNGAVQPRLHTHVAGTWSQATGTMRIFIDGVQDANVAAFAGPIFVNNTAVTVSSQLNAGVAADFHDGTLDEIRVQSVARNGFNGGVVIQQVTHTAGAGTPCGNAANQCFVLFNGNRSAAIDIQGFVFRDSEGNAYTVPNNGFTNIAVGGSVVIDLGAGADAAGQFFTNNGVGNTLVAGSFDNTDNLEMFPAAPGVTPALDIIDFVAWGGDAQAADNDAVTAGLWEDGTFVSLETELHQNTIQLFISNMNDLNKVGDNDDGVRDWTPYPYLSVLASARNVNQGDYYSSNVGAGQDTFYRYFIEVPPGTGELHVELFDADFCSQATCNTNATERNANRDRRQGGAFTNSSTQYRLIDPNGVQQAAFTGDSTGTTGAPGGGMNNTWMTPDGFRINAPGAGQWRVEVDSSSAIATGDDKNTYSLRAKGLQIYTNYTNVSANRNTFTVDHLFYPWINKGCSFNEYDFDYNNASGGSQGDLTFNRIFGDTAFATNLAEGSLSGNNAWNQDNITGFTNDEIQNNYGPIEFISAVRGTGGNGLNAVTLEMRDFNGGGAADAGDADVDANVIDIYLPGDNAGPPDVPYLIQFYNHVSGPNPPVVASATVLTVTVALVNPTGQTLNNVQVVANVPGGGVTYVGGSASVIPALGGGDTLTTPAAGGTGNITWTINSLNGALAGAELVYQVSVTPAVGGARIPVTGTPAANGTSANYENPARALAAAVVDTVGGICELAVTESSNIASTFVDLLSFTAQAHHDAVLLEWETGSEINNLGFYVYRREAGENEFVQISNDLIAGLINSPTGGKYYFIDRNISPGKTYEYLLEDIELDGDRTRHGPLDVSVAQGLGDFAASGFNAADYVTGSEWHGETGEVHVDDRGAVQVNSPLTIYEEEDAIFVEIYPEAPKLSAAAHLGQDYVKLELTGYPVTAEACSPQLPERGIFVPVPNRELVFTIEEIEHQDVVLHVDETLWPQPRYVLDHSGTKLTEEFCQDAAIYALDQNIPENHASFLGTQKINQKRMASIRLHPTKFNPATRRLRYAKKILLKISLGDELEVNPEVPALSDNELAHLALTKDNRLARIKTSRSGFHRISHHELELIGFPVDEDPRNFKLFYRGREQDILISGEDAQFDPGDAIIFHAQSNTDIQAEQENAYWLQASDHTGARMRSVDGTLDAKASDINTSWDELHLEEDLSYYFTMPNGANRDHWFWKLAVSGTPGNGTTFGNSLSFDFNVSDLVDSGSGYVLGYHFEGQTSNQAQDPDHEARVLMNGNLLGVVNWDGATPKSGDLYVPFHAMHEGLNQITIEAPGTFGFDAFYINHFKLTYFKRLMANADHLRFNLATSGNVTVDGFQTNSVYLFEDSEAERPRLVQNAAVSPQGANFRVEFYAGEGERYQAHTLNSFLSVTSLAMHAPEVLDDANIQVDYLVIAPETFAATITPLLNHRQTQGLRTRLVTVQSIADHFGFGVISPAAIKAFLSYAHFNWLKAPRYVLLVGDATYDPKGNLGALAGNTNFVPTAFVDTELMQAGSDAWYAQLAGNDQVPDLMLGRIPAENITELARFVAQIIHYESLPVNDDWHRRVTLVQDDVDAGSESTDQHFSQTIDAIQSKLPGSYDVTHITEASAGDVNAAKNQIINQINDGALFVNYVGHGAINLWASEGLLMTSDINTLLNQEKRAVFIAMNCLNAFFTFPGFESMAETTLFNEKGGAIAYWSSSGLTTPEVQGLLNASFYEAVFPNPSELASISPSSTLGEAINKATLALKGNSAANDVLNTWTLLGDPALQLKVPLSAQQIAEPVLVDSSNAPASQGLNSPNTTFSQIPMVAVAAVFQTITVRPVMISCFSCSCFYLVSDHS